MTVRELRQKYLQFFESKGHMVFPSGLLIPYDVTGRLDESLLFNGAGMVQFKPYFRGIAEPPSRRLTNAQKCVRTGDIDSVGDLSHLTFFEMMGNFSFGDYFKNVAIEYSWEFLTSAEWLGLDPSRLAFTVFEEDDEAYGCWAECLDRVGIDPTTRVFRLGEETNYWPASAFTSGPPGPCGPNSEMFYWTADEPPPVGSYTREDYLRDEKRAKWLEIWNDVFIQYEWQGSLRDPARPSEGYVKAGMPELPFRSVDTGMGLERTAAVLAGHGSVYETDAFVPILKRIEGVSSGLLRYGSGEESDRAMRIIGDHIRTACFCIADGILPSNTGRGYVLRRLIRRAVLKGQRTLGFDQPFLHLICSSVQEVMGDHYPELVERQAMIDETLRSEEDLFRRTLVSGYEMFMSVLRGYARHMWIEGLWDPDDVAKESRAFDRFHPFQTPKDFLDYFDGAPTARATDYIKRTPEDPTEYMALYETMVPYVFPGVEAFKLYDTYGFPLEVTEELCAEAGIQVDHAGYEEAMAEAQARSRGAHGMDDVYAGVELRFEFLVPAEDSTEGTTPTRFVGYEATRALTRVSGAVPEIDEGRPTGRIALALDDTPFYAESGGQVSDTGVIRGDEFEFRVIDLVKQDGIYVHLVEPVRTSHPEPFANLTKEELDEVLLHKVFNKPVEAEIDADRRWRIMRNHTATHLLHAALRSTLGQHVAQAGSLVSPDHLRFDFTHGKAMTPDEIDAVERLCNEQSLENLGVVTYENLPLAEARARGAMALFGEKYGEFVRMVEIGDFSRELCGGTHVGATGEIGLIKIVSESSAASGIRRIEALTGDGAYRWVGEQLATLRQASSILKANPKDLVHAVEKTLEQLREERKKRERLAAQGSGSADVSTLTIGSVELAIEVMREGEAKDATLVADRLVDNQPLRVALVALAAEGKLTFVAKVGSEALKAGAHAGNLVKEVAKAAGGGGGGRPDFATAGGRLPDQLDAALAAGRSTLAAQLGHA